MKRKSEGDSLPSAKKLAAIPKYSTIKENHQCFLDLTFASKLLSSKIADIPHKFKFEIIMKPILEYYFGTSDESFWDKRIVKYGNVSCPHFKIDWIRDQNLIYDQLFDYLKYEFLSFGSKLRELRRRRYILQILPYSAQQTMFFQKLQRYYKHDREIMMETVKENGAILQYIADELIDFEITKIAVQQCGLSLQYAPNSLKGNREIVTAAVRNNGGALEFASEELRNDFKIVKMAIQDYGKFIVYASQELRNNKELFLIALESTKMQHITYNHLLGIDNREFIIKLKKLNGSPLLEFASNELRNDREFVMQAVQQDPYEIGCASCELENDREIVKMAVKKNGACLMILPNFTHDREIVELALKETTFAFYFIDPKLSGDIEYISNLIGKRGFNMIPKEFIDNREILLESIKINSYNFNRAPTELKTNREFIIQALSNNGTALQFLNYEFKQDREIVMAAVTEKGDAIKYAPLHFIDDEELVLKAIETCKDANFYSQIPEHLRSDRNLALQLVKQSGKTLVICQIISNKIDKLSRKL